MASPRVPVLGCGERIAHCQVLHFAHPLNSTFYYFIYKQYELKLFSFYKFSYRHEHKSYIVLLRYTG